MLPVSHPAPIARQYLYLTRSRAVLFEIEQMWCAHSVAKESNGGLAHQTFTGLLEVLCKAVDHEFQPQAAREYITGQWLALQEVETVLYKLEKGVQTVTRCMIRSFSYKQFVRTMVALALAHKFVTEASVAEFLKTLREAVTQTVHVGQEQQLCWRELECIPCIVPKPRVHSASSTKSIPRTPRSSMEIQNTLRPASALLNSPPRLPHPSASLTRPATAYTSLEFNPQERGLASTPRSASSGHRLTSHAAKPTFKGRPGGKEPPAPYYNSGSPASAFGATRKPSELTLRLRQSAQVNFNLKPQSVLDSHSGVWMPLQKHLAKANVCDIQTLNEVMSRIHEEFNRQGPMVPQQIQQVLATVDEAGEGMLNEAQLGQGLVKLGLKALEPADLAVVFRHFDCHGQGVEIREFAWLFLERHQLMSQMRNPATPLTPTIHRSNDSPSQSFVENEEEPGLKLGDRSSLRTPHELQKELDMKRSTPCWRPQSVPLPQTGFGESVFAPQTVTPICWDAHCGRPVASSRPGTAEMQAERPVSLKQFRRPLPWFKEKQLRQKMRQTIDNDGLTQSLRLALHRNDNIDPATMCSRRFPIADQRRKVNRLCRFGFANNRHACDYGLKEQTEVEIPEDMKRLQKRLADAVARKKAGIVDTPEEKERGRQAGMRVFCKISAHMMKTRSNIKGAFIEFDRDNSGCLTPFELRECMKSLRVELDDDEFEIMIRLIDTDGNGTIDSSEFMNAIEDYTRMAAGKAPKMKRGRTGADLLYLDFAPFAGIGDE